MALQLLGTAISVKGTLDSTRAASSAALYNAEIDEQNALIAEQQGAAAVVTQRRFSDMARGQIAANYGASGVRTDTGSPLDVLEASAAQAKLDTQMIGYNTALQVRGFKTSAELNRRRARSGESAGLYSAAGQGILGGVKAYGMLPPGAGTKIPNYSYSGTGGADSAWETY